jgi:23S rRNA pseudouridine2605 synthase
MKSSPKSNMTKSKQESPPEKGERIAKRMARAGLCSRREAERWIEAGRVQINGQKLTTPAITVTDRDRIEVDGAPLPAMERTRLWLFHKRTKTITTNRDPEGRRTIFETLPKDMPRVLSVGRLDINTEGLLLLTNDGGLARVLELPATGWLRRYKVRAHGKVTQEQLDALKDGIAVEGVLYGSIEATLDREQGHNCWLTLSFREGKNREVKKVLTVLGLEVNRLIRLSYGPFQLSDLEPGGVREIRGRTLRDQLGERLIAQSGANFDAPLIHHAAAEKPETPAKRTSGKKKPKSQAELLARLDTRANRETGKDERKGKPLKKRFGKSRKKPTRDVKAPHADRRR